MAISQQLPGPWAASTAPELAFGRAFDPTYIRAFSDMLSAVGMYDLGFRPSGTEAGHRAGELIAEEMRRIGLSDMRREPFPVYAWGFRGARIELHGPARRTIPASSYPPTPGTPPEGLTGVLVDAGLGTAADYVGREVKGKIVFARLDVDALRWKGVLAYEAELHGAIGVVFYYLNGYAQHPSGEALNTHDGMCRDTIPILQVCVNDGKYLTQVLQKQGDVQVTLYSSVKADPEGTGHNVVGVIPGCRFPDRYLAVSAHYDAWFTGYWDNASGVAAMLAIAKALIDSGYRPNHTLLFVATDAEEFGAVDSIFDWLVGAQALLETHADWVGQTTCCFNFDTLSLKEAQRLRFYGSAEMVGFMRHATANLQPALSSFPEPQVAVDSYVTPWTETYSWTYFGVPVVQPSFDKGSVGETHYHTQFDTAEILGFDKSNEAVSLYGSLLIRLDQSPLPPYDFSTRAEAMHASVNWELARRLDVEAEVTTALAGLLERAQQANLVLAHANKHAWSNFASRIPEVDAISQQLRSVARYLLTHCSHLGGDFSHTVMQRHECRQANLEAVSGAISALEAGDARGALDALRDRHSGLPGAFFGQHTSYPTYHHFTLGAVNPERPNLIWGKERALEYVDCWIILHDLRDKLTQGVAEFGSELHVLRAQQKALLTQLREDFLMLAETATTAADMLPVEALRALV